MRKTLLALLAVGVSLLFLPIVPVEADVQCSTEANTSISFRNTTTADSIVYETGACSGETSVAAAFTDSIRAYWTFDDQFFGATANYESKVADNSLDLTPTNDPQRAPYTNRLVSADFTDGNSEYLSVADPWSSGDIDFSVGCWVMLDDLTGDLPIASKDDGTDQEWRLYYDDNTTDAWVFEIFDGPSGS